MFDIDFVSVEIRILWGALVKNTSDHWIMYELAQLYDMQEAYTLFCKRHSLNVEETKKRKTSCRVPSIEYTVMRRDAINLLRKKGWEPPKIPQPWKKEK